MTTRIIIRTCPPRTEFAAYLARHLPDAEFSHDQNFGTIECAKLRSYYNFQQALEMAKGDPAVHMEDDAILTVDFRDRLERAIREHSHNVIQFFSRRQDDIDIGSRWDSSFLCAVCFYLPATYSRRILRYSHQWPHLEEHPDGLDLMVQHWLRLKRESHWIHVPSLVDHRQEPSIIRPGRSSQRQAKTFRDPLE
jgi:hypothetical protein